MNFHHSGDETISLKDAEALLAEAEQAQSSTRETWKGVTVGWQNVYHKGFECEKLQETVGHITFSWMI